MFPGGSAAGGGRTCLPMRAAHVARTLCASLGRPGHHPIALEAGTIEPGAVLTEGDAGGPRARGSASADALLQPWRRVPGC